MDLSQLFPSFPEEQRQWVRSFLDKYCEIALKVFERLDSEEQQKVDHGEELR
jgi:hypothetical protein